MRPVVYSSPFVPAEWITAHGLRPTRLVPRARGPSRIGPLPGLCPFARAFIDEVLARDDAAGVVLATTCDQMRRAADVLAQRPDLPAFVMNVPSTWETVTAQRLYREELRRLGRFLRRIGGDAPSDQQLIDTMLAFDGARARVRSACERVPARRLAEMAIVLDDDIGPREEVSPSRGGVRLALVGGPLVSEDFVLYDAVEAAGGVIVLDATEQGERTMPAPFDRRRINDDPLGELADAYFGAIPDVFRRPNAGFYAWLGRELVERQVRGVIFHRYNWCDTWEAEASRLKEWSPVPVLLLSSGDGHDGARARLHGQVQAFLEVLA